MDLWANSTLLLPLVSLSNTKPISMVPLMYRRIHFTASQWLLQGSGMYLLTILTAYEKSSLVHTIAYIKLLLALAYSTWDIYSYSSAIAGDIIALSMKWGANSVLTNFVSPLILNFYSTFCKYPFWVKWTLPLTYRFQLSCQVPSLLLLDLSSQSRMTTISLIYQLLIYSWKQWAYHQHVAII